MSIGAGTGIVLVDDDPDQLLLCRMALQQQAGAAVTVSTYACPMKALEALSAEPAPDLIAVDVHMAPISGPQLVRRLRACTQFSAVPIVMLSSSDLAKDLEAARAAGATGYLLKPSGEAGWADVATRILGGWSDANLLRHEPRH